MRRALSKSPRLRERPAIEVKGKSGKLAVYSVAL
jgi:hypothetical protein